MRPLYHRKDNNHDRICRNLLKVPGCTVKSVAGVIDEFDAIVGYRGVTYLMEIKDGEDAKLRESQIEFMRQWKGHYAVVRSDADALRMIGLEKKHD